MNRITKKIGVSLFVLATVLSFASCDNKLEQELPTSPEVKIGKLENGLTYYIKQNRRPKNEIQMNLVVNAGSVLEDDDQRGFAHFCEHMAFNGTENFPDKEMIDYFESIGSKFGEKINAYTSFDETVYELSIPAGKEEYIDKGLLAVRDWASAVSDTDKEIDAERGVIHEEFRTRYDVNGRLLNKSLPYLFHNSKYAERHVIGTYEIIDYGKPDALRRYRKDWYRPDLQAVIVVGDFNIREMEQKVKSVFSEIPKQEAPKEKPAIEIPGHAETLVAHCTDEELNSSSVVIYYKHPFTPVKTVGDFRTDLIQNLYTSMLTDRLLQAADDEERIAPFFTASAGYSQFIGEKNMYILRASVKEDRVTEAIASLLEENKRALSHGFTKAEFERTKKKFISRAGKAFRERNTRESKNYVEDYIRNFTLAQLPVIDPKINYDLTKELLEDISLKEIKETGQMLNTRENRVVIINAPEKDKDSLPDENTVLQVFDEMEEKELEAYSEGLNLEELLPEEPTPGKVIREQNVEGVEDLIEWEMSNGARVFIKPTNYKNDQIYFGAYSPGGYSVYDDADYISASFAPDIISYVGIGDFSPVDLGKALSGKMVQVRLGCGDYSEGLGGNSTVEDFETMLKIAHLYFTAPRESKPRYEALLEKINLQLKNKYLDPNVVWNDTVSKIMASYHPRVSPVTVERVNQELDYDKVYKIYRERFSNAGDFSFFFAGSLNPETVKPLVEKYIGGLPGNNTKKETWTDRDISPPKGKVEHTMHLAKEQRSIVRILFPDTEMDYSQKNKLVSRIMCDALSNALMENIREKQGGVYSIRAYPYFSPYPTDNLSVSIQFVCDPVRVEELKKLVFDEIQRIKKEGVTPEDLASILNQIEHDDETSRETNDYWMKLVQEYLVYRLDFKEFPNLIPTLKQVTNDDIKNMATEIFEINTYKNFNLMPEK
ncbi:M16 family metallopeptidase [Mariniphaga sediminis]|uniref:M16 family metallopeptidase n=1 Tax=Mariniphaga sediminis TaxID=1628158 RepID=UPI00356632D1